MKRFTVVFILISLTLSVSAQEFDLDRMSFVDDFHSAVIAQTKSKVIKCMDKVYRKEQVKFLGGKKQQFVDEIFGGSDLDNGNFSVFKLVDIEFIEIEEIKDLGQDTWEYIFHVTSEKRMIQVNLELKKRNGKYGFVGASG